MDNFKSPLSFSTDDIYLQAKTDIEKNVVINVDDSDSLNPTVNILLNIPVKDINKILYGKDKCVDCDKNLKSSTLKDMFDSIKRKIKERNDGPIIIDFITGKRIFNEGE